jgi:hypothetical protein
MTDFGGLWGLGSGEGLTREQADHLGVFLCGTQTGVHGKLGACLVREGQQRERCAAGPACLEPRVRPTADHLVHFCGALYDSGDHVWHQGHGAPCPTNCGPYGLYGRVPAAGTCCFLQSCVCLQACYALGSNMYQHPLSQSITYMQHRHQTK